MNMFNMNKIVVRCFAQKARLTFPNRHDNINTVNKTETNKVETKSESSSNNKSNHDTLTLIKESFRYRPSISNEEIEAVNNGGSLNIKDWNKIKLKQKIKV